MPIKVLLFLEGICDWITDLFKRRQALVTGRRWECKGIDYLGR